MIAKAMRTSACIGTLLSGTAIALLTLATAPALAQPAGPPPPTPSAGSTTTPLPTGEAVSSGTANDVASNAPNNSAGSGNATGDIVVTGSRIVRNGYTAPTPVTVVSTEQLQRSAPGAIPEGLNQLPQFAGSRTNQTVGGNATTPAGGNYLNLRNLGAIRTLTLLDGQRLPPTSFDGTVDSNIIPQALIARVEVVTGGASAAYGSDAVSGVINFVLDTKFKGLKGQAQFGQSKYNDADTYKFNVAGGFGVFEDRVHFLFSYDHYQQQGIKDNLQRKYGALNRLRTGTGTAANPYIDFDDVRYATATYGTLISNATGVNANNPLRGMQFVNGALVAFNPGITTGTSGYNRGGDGVISFGKTLTGTQNTDQAFGRVDVEITDGVTGFVQGTYANSFNSYITIGSGTQIGDFQIFRDNPFLPDNVRTTLAAANINSFVAGRIEADQPPKLGRFYNNVFTIVSGLKGKVAGFDWSLGYSHGDSNLHVAHEGNFNNSHWLAALDAVRGPQGNIVCRITITNPGLQDNCVPINIFGNGSPSKAAYDYVSQISRYRVVQKMDILSANISGDIFELPAGPVSVAIGGEYRKQKLTETTNSDPTKSIDLTGLRTNVPVFILPFNSTNVGSAFGKLDVKEAYGEVAVPVLKDSALGKSLDLNGAVRYTDYSTSGSVETWKVGVSYIPIESIRFRATKSRDIRAPTLYELYAGPQATRGQFSDRLTGLNNNVISYTQGNANLKPEKGDTFTGGVVFSPTFVPRLSMSVDYYKIRIRDSIGTLSLDTIQAQCAASNGTADVCAAIVRPFPYSNSTPANFPTATLVLPFNQANLNVRGIDYEISYRIPLGGMIFDQASIDLRLIGGHLIDFKTQAQTGGAVLQTNNTVGTLIAGANVKDRINILIGYRDGPFSLDGQVRYLGPAKRTQDPALIYVENDVKSRTYTDVTAQYRFKVGGVAFETYVTVNNLFNTQPPLFSTGGQPGQTYPTNPQFYDLLGRMYTGGLRVRF